MTDSISKACVTLLMYNANNSVTISLPSKGKNLNLLNHLENFDFIHTVNSFKADTILRRTVLSKTEVDSHASLFRPFQ